MAMYAIPSASPASYTGMTFGWSKLAAAWASARKRCRISSLSNSSGAITLSATIRSSPIWVAR